MNHLTHLTRLTTERLRLEPCDLAHLDGLHAMNSDPEVMHFIGRPETPEETRQMVDRVQSRWREFGYSWWTFLDRETGDVVGAGCIQNLRRDASANPDPACPVEIGWRLRRERWHQGFAIEGAVAMAEFAFSTLKVPELYAVCEPENVASAAVMRRLGMEELGLQTWYSRTLLTYRTTAEAWQRRG